MNNITSQKASKDQVVNVKQTKKEKQHKFIGSLEIKRGHTLYEIHLKNHTIEPAKFEESIASFVKESSKVKSKGFGIASLENGNKKIVLEQLPNKSKKLIRNKDCIYISALNKKNVLKKLEQRGVIKTVKK